jgi:hypothetical protein
MKNKERHQERHDMMKSHHIEEHRHDPYKARQKLHEPSVCGECMAVFIRGRWQWTTEPLQKAQWETCPACHRIHDNYPAGELTLGGGFLKDHAQEIIRLARNAEALENREHPLQRIMGIEEAGDHVVITTTDIHLARRIAHAIEDAYKGELITHYDDPGYFVRMTWKRD